MRGEEIIKEMKAICKNCKDGVTENYCSKCGRPKKLEKINGSYIWKQLSEVILLEKGLFYTTKELAIRPGSALNEFLTTDRNRLVKPVVFIFLTVLISVLVANALHIEIGNSIYENGKKDWTNIIFNWLAHHRSYGSILNGILVAMWAKLFFKNYNYNFWEIVIAMCFIIGMTVLISVGFDLLDWLTTINLDLAANSIQILYISWALGQFFGKKIINYFKAFLSLLLGIGTLSILVVLLVAFMKLTNII